MQQQRYSRSSTIKKKWTVSCQRKKWMLHAYECIKPQPLVTTERLFWALQKESEAPAKWVVFHVSADGERLTWLRSRSVCLASTRRQTRHPWPTRGRRRQNAKSSRVKNQCLHLDGVMGPCEKSMVTFFTSRVSIVFLLRVMNRKMKGRKGYGPYITFTFNNMLHLIHECS